jgi:hypothetical protein
MLTRHEALELAPQAQQARCRGNEAIARPLAIGRRRIGRLDLLPHGAHRFLQNFRTARDTGAKEIPIAKGLSALRMTV